MSWFERTFPSSEALSSKSRSGNRFPVFVCSEKYLIALHCFNCVSSRTNSCFLVVDFNISFFLQHFSSVVYHLKWGGKFQAILRLNDRQYWLTSSVNPWRVLSSWLRSFPNADKERIVGFLSQGCWNCSVITWPILKKIERWLWTLKSLNALTIY